MKDERPVSCGSRECRRTERQRHAEIPKEAWAANPAFAIQLIH